MNAEKKENCDIQSNKKELLSQVAIQRDMTDAKSKVIKLISGHIVQKDYFVV